MAGQVLFISDQKYIASQIQGGVQLCTQEYIKYITLAGYSIKEFPVKPSINFLTRIKIKAGVDAYEHYSISKYLSQLVQCINSSGMKLVFFNQLNLAVWAAELKKHVAEDVKFIGLSHGNESGDYLHDITRQGPPGKLQTWKLGQLLVKEADLFSSALNGVIVINEFEIAINKWLGANNVLFLPRLLTPGFIAWQPVVPKAGFVGTLDHLPNLLGIRQLAQELQNQNYKYKLMLVGGPVKLGRQLAKEYSFIEYMGQLDDTALFVEVKTWSVFLNPVFWYARGSSTKLALAINWGLPCITTEAGKRGYSLNDETIVTDDDTPKKFAQKLIKALDEPQYLNDLKKSAENNAINFDAKPWLIQLNNFLNKLI